MIVLPIHIDAGITGFESPAAEYKELGLSLDDLLIANPNATFIGLANGHSMENVGIYHKDVLIVDRSKKPVNGDVVVANFNGVFVCKIIDIRGMRLLSASQTHPPVNITEGDVFQLEGIVTNSIRMFRENNRLLSCFH